MSVVLLITNGPDARRIHLHRWLSLLGHHGLDVRTADEARLTLGCVKAKLVIADAGGEHEETVELSQEGESGELRPNGAELVILDFLQEITRAGDARPPVFVVGAPPKAYRHFRSHLGLYDRFLGVPVDSDVAKQTIAEFLADAELSGASWPWLLPAFPARISSN